MDIVKIQALIAQGRIVELTDIDPTQSFVQIGVYQPDNRKIGSANNTYLPFVIPLNELGGGGNVTNTITVTVNLNTTNPQIFTFPTGKFIPHAGYLSNATIDTSLTTASNLQVGTGGNVFCQSEDPGPCLPPACDDALNYLFVPANYFKLYFGESGPGCWPPPCNGQYVINGGSDLTIQLATASGIAGTVDVHIMVYQIS
jgi:hypothetical protein